MIVRREKAAEEENGNTNRMMMRGDERGEKRERDVKGIHELPADKALISILMQNKK